MNRSMRLFIVIFFLVSGLSSCYINRDFMFQPDSDFMFDTLAQDTVGAEFRIKPNTSISVSVFTNGGALLLDYSTGGGEGRRFMSSASLPYMVDAAGYVELPVIGKQYLQDKTVREAQDALKAAYEEHYNDTYVIVRVENRRVMVYNGSNGQGKVVPLSHNGISIIEAITMAGGISVTGDAAKVRVMRRKGDGFEVYEIDLSKIEGIQYANTSAESGDIIYVQPIPRLGREILENIQPIVTIISTTSVLILAITRLF